MIWIIILALIMIIALGYGAFSMDFEFTGVVTMFVGCAGLIISVICLVCICYDVSQVKVVDQKIAMYQEENEKIEAQIDTLVKNYMEYESGTYAELKNESKNDAITLVSLYPELKADTLVQEQIKIYTTNNEKIKELKEQKINGSVYRWWLYFGK